MEETPRGYARLLRDVATHLRTTEAAAGQLIDDGMLYGEVRTAHESGKETERLVLRVAAPGGALPD